MQSFCAFLFKVSAIKRKYKGCCAHFSETLTIESVPQWWKPSNVAQPGCSISGSSYANTVNPTGLQAVITWNEYFNYVMILITAYLPLLQLVFLDPELILHTSWNWNLPVPLPFLFLGGVGWDFTGELIILIMTCTLLVSLQLGLVLTGLFPGVICSHNDISAFLWL